ncbi:hypothetical protein [Arthrobacter sp. yr096]|uniref:hypothetical protein n=1 Tax=Arthrobacter sp. yr096 TaxID=1761750 RepID=UPI000B8596F6|nr:hypothetical protein [Arthrobacter sp. yr096]
MGVDDGAIPEGGGEEPPQGLTSEDLRLGKRAVKVKTILCLAALASCLAIAIFVMISVPWDTRMPYDGKFDRSGSGIPMQIAFIPCAAVLFALWRSGKKADAHHMGKNSRIAYYILTALMISACVAGQFFIGQEILTIGGYFDR